MNTRLWTHPILLNAAIQVLGPTIAGHPVWNLRTKVVINSIYVDIIVTYFYPTDTAAKPGHCPLAPRRRLSIRGMLDRAPGHRMDPSS